MHVQWTSVVISFATGALTGALVTYFRHWLARRREEESREFAQSQERDRIRREDCSHGHATLVASAALKCHEDCICGGMKGML